MTHSEFSFTVNGKNRQIVADPMQPLSRVLRDVMGLNGTKIGCEAGDCGACTVLVDGRQCCACLVPVGQCESSDITTVEGSAINTVLKTLQASFLKCGATQCGICTPGMLMSATDLLQRNKTPTKRDVEDAIGGTLCRCTGYVKIVDAIRDAAQKFGIEPNSQPAVSTCAVVNHVGANIPRVDGMQKVKGSELFAADTAPEDALWLRIVRSPHPHARFSTGDFSAVMRDYPGLVKVLTAEDVPGHNGFGIYPTTKDQPVFAENRVLFRGDAVLGLVGDRATIEAIEWKSLPIVWTKQTAHKSMTDALLPNAEQLHANRKNNILIEGRAVKGNQSNVDSEELIQVTDSFTTSFVEHGYIEPEAGYARRVGDRIEVYAATQAPAMDLEEIANVLGISKSKVRIIPSACGGGFGGKLDVSVQPALAVAAWTLNRPVRMIYNRVESMAASTKRHPAEIKVKIAADAQGKLHGFHMTGDFNTGAYASWGPTVAGRVPLHCTGPYSVNNVYCHTRAIHTNACPSGAFRGFGTPQAAIAREIAYDQLAEKLGIDRWTFRHINAFKAGDTTPSGQQLNHSVGMTECLEALHADWQEMLEDAATINEKNDAGNRRGVGIACMWYGCGNTGLSNPSTMRVELGKDGRLVFYNGAVDIGQGSSTVLLQVCADALGLPIDQFEMVIGDTDHTDDAGKTSASRQTFVSGKAAMLAGRHLRSQLLNLMGANADAALSLVGTVLKATRVKAMQVKTTPVKATQVKATQVKATGDHSELSVDLAQADLQGKVALVGTGTFDPPITPLDCNGQGNAYATYAFAAQICSVDVNTRLGTVKPRKFVAAHDVGRAINPQLVQGQIEGGIVQGLGMALMEEYLPGRTENLHDYLMPTAGDVPEIAIKLIEAKEPLGPYGAKGVGEPALVPTPAAILSAIRDATGVTMKTVPVLPHRLFKELQKSRQKESH